MASSHSKKPSLSANSAAELGEETPRRDVDFYQDHVVFRVEDVIYRVTRERLEAFSPVLRNMFAMPQPPPPPSAGSEDQIEGATPTLPPEGQSDETPIVLEGYTSLDFGRLLTLLYPKGDSLPGEAPPLTTKDEWISILKLSTVWEMEKVRNLAISKLSWMALTPTDKIHLGRSYRIPSWFSEGVSEIALSKNMSALSLEDFASTLGWETAARILYVRTTMLDSSLYGALDLKHLVCALPDCTQPISTISTFGKTVDAKCCAGHPSVRTTVTMAQPAILGGAGFAPTGAKPMVRFKLSNVLAEGTAGLAPPQYAGIAKIFERELNELS